MTFGLNTLFKGAASLALTLTQVFGFITRADYYYRTDRPLLIAHRGTYGYYPEHALGGYIEAYYAGADFIEFDVQITKDKELVILHDPYLDYCTDIRDHLDRFGHKTYRGWHFVPDFTLAELRTIYLKQRFPFRTKKNNKKFVVLTFQEVIDLIHTLNTEFPRTKNAERKIGLYIELKDWQWNMDWIGYNTADVFWDLLKKNNLETIEKARLDIPIVVQSFELEALEYFRTLGDLPNTFLVGVDCADVWELIYLAYEQLYFMYPYVTWDIIPDWGELANQISGISPDHQYVNRPGAPTDPMTDKWDRLTVVDAYSEFNKMAHDLDLAIHPWPLQDDRLVYKKKLNQYHETKLYVVKGVDGFFAEFPIDTMRWFEDLGNHSTLDFEHPAHSLEHKDLNLEITKKCIADRYRYLCMSNETLFGKTAQRDIFLGPKLRPWVKNQYE